MLHSTNSLTSRSRNRVTTEARDDVADCDTLLTHITTINQVLEGHASALGNDFVAYRNHVYRVVNLCVAITRGRGDLEKIAAAAAFHDLGIWTDRTFDYIPPSIALAREYLVARAREDWITEISAMIADHHKITPSMADSTSLVEAFRQADWIDVTGGLRSFGIPHPFVARLFATWPDAGFHWRLVQLAIHRFRTHPLTPLPMVRL
jgi:hypothetical protein